MKIILETARLQLRLMEESDYEALDAVLADSDIMQHYPYTFDEDRVRGWISRNIERYRIFGFGLWAVVLKETGELIGDCGLTVQIIHGQPCPEIGYHIRRDFQRQGYAKEVASATLKWAFENTPFNEIYSYMKYTNVSSYSTALSIGMKFVEEYEDEVNTITKVYAITRSAWDKMQGGGAGHFSGGHTTGVTIRAVQRSDISRCAEIFCSAYNNEVWQCCWDNATAQAYLNDYFEAKSFVGYVLEVNGQTVGGIFCRIKKWWNNSELFVEEMFVSPAFQRKGLGEKLLQAAEEYACEQGLAGLTLSTNRYAPAHSFYLKNGFVDNEFVGFMYKQL